MLPFSAVAHMEARKTNLLETASTRRAFPGHRILLKAKNPCGRGNPIRMDFTSVFQRIQPEANYDAALLAASVADSATFWAFSASFASQAPSASFADTNAPAMGDSSSGRNQAAAIEVTSVIPQRSR